MLFFWLLIILEIIIIIFNNIESIHDCRTQVRHEVYDSSIDTHVTIAKDYKYFSNIKQKHSHD